MSPVWFTVTKYPMDPDAQLLLQIRKLRGDAPVYVAPPDNPLNVRVKAD